MFEFVVSQLRVKCGARGVGFLVWGLENPKPCKP